MYHKLNSNKLSSEVYLFIKEHLETIAASSETPQELHDNIKLVTYNYLLYTDAIYFVEGFQDILDTIKITFWSNTLPAWSGKVSLYNWLTGVVSKTVVTGNFGITNFGTSLANQIFSKITTGSALRVAGEKINPVDLATNAQMIRLFSVVLFPTILFGLVIYRLINYSDILLIKNFEASLNSVITTLRLSNDSELSELFKTLNTKYENILKDNCSKISDEKTRLTCASTYYVKYVTEDIMTRVIFEYLSYLKKNNVDYSYITNFNDLCSINININPILFKRLSILYTYYIKLLKVYVFDETIRRNYINLLDKTTITNAKTVYST